MASIEVQPRRTPEERAFVPVEVEIEPDLRAHAEIIEDWVTPRQSWELQLREGHDFGRANNVEGRVLFVSGEQTSGLSFRLDQLDRADDTGEELVLQFEEQDGIAKIARSTARTGRGAVPHPHHDLMALRADIPLLRPQDDFQSRTSGRAPAIPEQIHSQAEVAIRRVVRYRELEASVRASQRRTRRRARSLTRQIHASTLG